MILTTTGVHDEVFELDKFVTHDSNPIFSYGTSLDCDSESPVNAAHLALEDLATHAVLECAVTEPRNGRKLEVASDILSETGILDERCPVKKLSRSACLELRKESK